VNEYIDELRKNAEELTRGIPVTWDRHPASNSVFGWIKRDDGRRDFVLVVVDRDGSRYFTSSGRWSAKMAENWDVTHLPCQKCTWSAWECPDRQMDKVGVPVRLGLQPGPRRKIMIKWLCHECSECCTLTRLETGHGSPRECPAHGFPVKWIKKEATDDE